MKRSIIIGLALVAGAFLFSGAPAEAGNYAVALSTYVPTESLGSFTSSGHPQISGNLYVRKLTLSNIGGEAQTVTLYNTSTSSLTATVAGYWIVAASSTLQVDLLPRALQLTSPGWQKLSADTTVYINVNYE